MFKVNNSKTTTAITATTETAETATATIAAWQTTHRS